MTAITMFIERPETDPNDPHAPQAITLAQWKRAIQKVEGVRLADGDGESRHPFTKETVTVPNTGGDAEVRLRNRRWARVFSWHREYVRFEARPTTDDPIMQAAKQLAKILHAEIRDENGSTHPH